MNKLTTLQKSFIDIQFRQSNAAFITLGTSTDFDSRKGERRNYSICPTHTKTIDLWKGMIAT